MVDKVFADWQKNPKSKSPNLETRRILVPFGNTTYNKFTLTNIPPAKTLDFESNLCYCYDCDLDQDFDTVKLPERTGEFLSGSQPIFEPIEAIAEYDPRPEPSYQSPFQDLLQGGSYSEDEYSSYSEDDSNEDSVSFDAMSSNSGQFDSLIKSKSKQKRAVLRFEILGLKPRYFPDPRKRLL